MRAEFQTNSREVEVLRGLTVPLLGEVSDELS